MSTIVTRAGKGSPLTNTEVDSNFTNLNTDKLESDGSVLADKIAFDTAAALTPTTGQMVWDAETGTVDIGLNGATAPVMSVGEDQFYRVINQAGSTITKGTLVMAAGTIGASGVIKVAPWNGSQPSKTIMGLAMADIPTENDPTESGLGYILAFGKLRGIQTNGGNYSESWVDGDIIYAGSSGGLTKTMPAAPNVKTTVAIVINAHASNGTLFVRPTYGSNLGEDELVQLSGLAGGDVLSYDATDGRFENKTLADAGIYASSNPAGYTTNTGTVTSVGGTGTVNGITLTGTVTSSGNLTLGGTLSGVSLTTQVTGTLPVANGGTGITSFGTGVATWLGTPSSANLAAAVTDETGSGALVFGTAPTLAGPTIVDPILTLGGTNGTAGQVPVSQGVGLPPVWGAVSSPEVKAPTNVSPAGGATNIGATPALTGSTYYSLYGVAMAAAQWQVSTVSDFASTVVNTGDVAGTSVTYTVGSGVLSTSTTYYWRVRYKDSNGVYSDWSAGTSFTTAASFGPTTIGEAYGGGYYAGKIVQGGSTYYLIVAPKSSGENSSKQWKTTNDAGPSATITLNNGPAASSSMNSASYPAAQFCEGLSIGGYTDWYLPSRDELELCYRNLKPTTTANNTSARNKSSYTYPEGNDVSGDTMGINRNSNPTGAAYTSSVPAQTSVTLFQTGNSEAFAAAAYWSSSEYSASGAWVQTFGSGYQANGNKGDSYYVRAVRRLPV